MRNFLKAASLTLLALTTAIVVAEVIKETEVRENNESEYWD